jgi:glycosyltransferase involved in cell wall biosynthesis
VRICIISSFFNLDLNKDLANGGGKHITILAKEWTKYGNEIFSVSTNVHFNDISVLKDTIRAILGGDEEYFKNCNPDKMDIILSASPYPPDLIRAARIGRITNKKVHAYFHHITPPLFWKPFQRGFFRTLLNRLYIIPALAFCKILDIHIFLDQPQEYELGSLTVHKDNDAIENSPLEGAEFHPVNSDSAEIKDIDIFFIGRISKNKGVINIVKAMKILRSKGILLNAVLAGPISDFRYYSKIVRYLDKHGMSPQVLFTDKITDEEKQTYLRRSKMFVFPSFEEGWSLSVMEAAASGIPIVAFDLEAYSYLEGNYFKSKPDYKSLAESIMKCLTENDLSEKYSRRASTLVRSYSYAEIAEEQIQIFMNELL